MFDPKYPFLSAMVDKMSAESDRVNFDESARLALSGSSRDAERLEKAATRAHALLVGEVITRDDIEAELKKVGIKFEESGEQFLLEATVAESLTSGMANVNDIIEAKDSEFAYLQTFLNDVFDF